MLLDVVLWILQRDFQFMAKRQNSNWFKKIISFRIFGVPLSGWFGILCITAFIGLMYYWFMFEFGASHTETVTGEISNLWAESVEGRGGGGIVYYVEFTTQDDELTCSMSPVAVGLWSQLKEEKSFKLSISQTRSRCYIYEVQEVDSDNSF